jgi:hypothetical protein
MGLKLSNDSLFLHIPKTGGSFVTHYLASQKLIKENAGGKHDDIFRCLYPQTWPKRASQVIKELPGKVTHRLIDSKDTHDWKLGPREEQPTAKDLPYMFCFVRNPVSWIESYFNYCVREEWYNWSTEYDYGGFWHPNATLNSLKSVTLNEFIEKLLVKRPGYVTEMFGWYTTAGAKFIGKTENLREDLAKFLNEQGLPFDKAKLFNEVKKNVSQTAGTNNNWDRDLLKEFVACEYASFKRFGYELPSTI